MCPLIVSTECRQYLAPFEYVSPGQVSKFPLFISLSQFDLTRNPDVACMYRTSASKIGRSYALYSERVAWVISVVWCSGNSLYGFIVNGHSLGSSFYLHPIRMGLPLGENTAISWLVNKTVQSEFHIGTTPTNVLVNDGMMYPTVGKYAANCGIVSVAVADDLSTFIVALPKLIC